MTAGRSKADVTREKIVRSAAKIVRKYGHNRMTLRDIAKDIGIKAGSIYYHFASRDEIIRAILEDAVGSAIDAVTEAIQILGEDATPLEKLEAALRVHLKYVVARQFSSSLDGIRQLPKKLREEHMAREREYAAIFNDLIEELADEGQIREGANLTVVRMLSLGALTWVSEWYDPHGPMSLDDVLDTYMALLRSGVVIEKRDAKSSPRGASRVRRPAA